MHTILLIWKHSQHYNTPPRLVVLMREISNALINQACSFLSGEEIFRLIEDDSGGPRLAVAKLETTLKVCGLFKSTYFDYKARPYSSAPLPALVQSHSPTAPLIDRLRAAPPPSAPSLSLTGLSALFALAELTQPRRALLRPAAPAAGEVVRGGAAQRVAHPEQRLVPRT